MKRKRSYTAAKHSFGRLAAAADCGARGALAIDRSAHPRARSDKAAHERDERRKDEAGHAHRQAKARLTIVLMIMEEMTHEDMGWLDSADVGRFHDATGIVRDIAAKKGLDVS